MKKEYLSIFSVVFIVLAHIIDFISGKINLPVKNPYQFLGSPLISQYPLTSLGILVRSVGLFVLVWLFFSLIKGYYFKKIIVLLVIFLLSNLYAIQQLATGMKITTVQWTLSIAYGSILLLIPVVYYFFKTTTKVVSQKISIPKKPTESSSDQSADSQEQEDEE